MIQSPCKFEAKFSDQELQKLGQFVLRWSYIEHVVSNCLRVLLTMDPKPATIMVFPLGLYDKMDRIEKLDKLQPMKPEAKALFLELKPLTHAVQYVRNTAIHGIFIDFLADEPFWHLRSKDRALSKSELFSCEELINYAAHIAEEFRISLGGKEDTRGPHYALPDRPPIPDFLPREAKAFPMGALAGQQPPPKS